MKDFFLEQALSIERANAALNIWDGPVRSGKTVASIIAWTLFVAQAQEIAGAHLFMVGKTERTLENNILKLMKDYYGRDFGYSMGKHKARLFDREILLFGANDEGAEAKIRGLTGIGCYGDEISLWPESFFKMMRSRLSIEDAKFYGTTNPDGPMHYLHREYLKREGEIDLKRFNWSIEKNNNLPQKYIEDLKKEYVGLFYRRFILGHWCMAEGAIYDFFQDGAPYVLKPKDLPTAVEHFAAVDYGTQNPFCCGLFGYNPTTRPKIWLEKEYWYDGRNSLSQKTDGEYSADLKDFFGKIAPRKIIVDPSASSFILQLRKDGFFGVTEADNSVMDGIRVQSKMLKNGEYAISEECVNTRKEYDAYVWDPKAALRGEDKPLKQDDHSKDMERYMLNTQFGQDHLDYEKLTTM